MNKISLIIEMKALVFIVLEHEAYEGGQRPLCVASDEVTRHLALEHIAAFKVIDQLRIKKLVWLRKRFSAGMTGNGYDGALFGALTPTGEGIAIAKKYLRGDKRSSRR